MTLKRRILEELQRHPADTSRIRVSATASGLVTIEGSVTTYADRCSIEELVKGVPGVTALQNRLEVRLTIGDYRTDATLERVLREMLDCLARMPAERPRVTVTNGWVILEGAVSQAFQKQLVENAVREVAGIRGITNQIEVATERRTERPPLASTIS